MKKLIELFNKKYGHIYGVIDDSIDNEDVFKAYKIIKTLCADDNEIMELLNRVKLPEPKTAKESIEKININVSGGGGTDTSIKEYIDKMDALTIKKLNDGYIGYKVVLEEEELDNYYNNTITLSNVNKEIFDEIYEADAIDLYGHFVIEEYNIDEEVFYSGTFIHRDSKINNNLRSKSFSKKIYGCA